MCGISGTFYKKSKKASYEVLEKMNSLVTKRGPDGEGIYINNEIGFGHRRLSIIDLSENGKQPMTLDNLTITYNGEIFNYVEIRDELKALGHIFSSDSDTEVILHSYRVWGQECVQKFNGMWAFAIHDTIKNVIFCSRDRFGIKPFYFFDNEDIFAFGSEIKQLLDFDNARKVNIQRVCNYLLYGESENNSNTFFKSVNKLPASHNLIYNCNLKSYEILRYYDLKKNDNYFKYTYEEASQKFKALLTDAVRLRMRSDVRVGACLSGGLDSSTIVSLANLNNPPENFMCINAKSIEKKFDESHFANMVSEFTKTNLKIVTPDSDDFIKSVEMVIYNQEEPFGNPSPVFQNFVFKSAKEEGCIVMLDGQGGDEDLLGYTFYIGPILIKSFFKNLNIISINSQISILSIIKQIFLTIFYRITSTNLYLKTKNKHFKSSVFRFRNDSMKLKRQSTFLWKSIFDLQKNEIYEGSLPSLLRFEDKNSMANSIETRLPFLDYRVVELCLSLPYEFKLNDGWLKFLIRDTMEGMLPKDILWRKEKFGFNSPNEEWLKNKPYFLKEIKKSIILRELVYIDKIDTLDNTFLWRLFNVAIWEKLYKVSI